MTDQHEKVLRRLATQLLLTGSQLEHEDMLDEAAALTALLDERKRVIKEAQDQIRTEYAPVLNINGAMRCKLHEWAMGGSISTHSFGFSRRDCALKLIREVYGENAYWDQIRKIEEFQKEELEIKKSQDKRRRRRELKGE